MNPLLVLYLTIHNSMKTNKSHIFASLIAMPIIYFIVSFLFFRGNYAAYGYVDTYIANSNVIELTLPRYDSIERNAKSYTYKLVKGPSGTKCCICVFTCICGVRIWG